MKKRIFIVFVIGVIMIIAQFSVLINEVWAEVINGGDADGVSWTYDSETHTVTFSGSGELKYEWRNEAFQAGFNPVDVEHVIIEEGITSIGDEAFGWVMPYYPRLKTVEIPNTVINIGDFAFTSCCELKNIQIPNSVTSIGYAAFSLCDSLEKITIGTGLTSLDDTGLDWCTVSTIEVDENNQYFCVVDGVLFNKDKTELILYPAMNEAESYEIPGSVERINHGAFYNAYNLKSIKVNESNKKYSDIDGVLYNKDKTELIKYPMSKQGDVEIPNGVTKIGDDAFARFYEYYCDDENEENNKMISIEIPHTVTSIGDCAFYTYYPNLSIAVPNSVTRIGSNLFRDEDLGVIPYLFYKSDGYPKEYFGYAVTLSLLQEKLHIDDTSPTISNVTQDGVFIKVQAVDNEDGAGLASKAYSLDNENWQSSNEIKVASSGTYTIYVRDKLYNVATKTIDVTVVEPDNGNNGSNQKGGNEESGQKQKGTEADTILPDTGVAFPIVTLIIILAVVFITYKKFKKVDYKY